MLSEEYKVFASEESYKNSRYYRCLLDRLQAQSIPAATASKIAIGCLFPSTRNDDARIYLVTNALDYLLLERWHVVSLSFTTYADTIAYILAWKDDFLSIRCFSVRWPSEEGLAPNRSPFAPSEYVKEVQP